MSIPIVQRNPVNQWIVRSEFMRVMHAMHEQATTNHMHWLNVSNCKYVMIRVDQRTGDFLLADQNGSPLPDDVIGKLYPQLIVHE